MIDPVPLPPPVREGARVGVAALSGPVDPEKLDTGLDALRELGYEPSPAKNLRRRHGLFAGRDEERLDAFHELARRDDVEAILFARGGWGALRILPRVDWGLLARRPRAYVGYSDLTPFLHEVVRRCGFAAFHGPMVAADLARGLGEAERESFRGALAGRYPADVGLEAVEEGEPVEGPLLGGCLSLLTSTLGTEWAPDLEGALLVLEELDEPPYRFDRMLTHLRHSGTLARIAGMIVGHLHAEGRDELTAQGGEVTLRGILRELSDEFPWPLAEGLRAGHASPNLTLPLGTLCRLDPASRSLRLAVSAEPER